MTQSTTVSADDIAERKRRQTDGADLPILPDACNLGTVLRVLVAVNLGLALAALTQAVTLRAFFVGLLGLAAIIEPVALATLAILCPTRKFVNGKAILLQWGTGLVVPAVLTFLISLVLSRLMPIDAGGQSQFGRALVHALVAAVASGVLIEWLRLRQISLLPSQAEGRLQALQARIRPHFLFNSLNTVLGLIRNDVRQAERTLENLADLFRVFMRDSRELVPLDEEVLLCKEYLSIEKLRLADRLRVVWHIDDMPGDALLPSLLLQPLIENAVHHGIEPRSAGGEVVVTIEKSGERVRVEIVNPLPEALPTRPSNQMALSNVRERLSLTFDVEGQLLTATEDGQFRVTVHFPYRKERRRRDARPNFDTDR